jgi:hypothetical protein
MDERSVVDPSVSRRARCDSVDPSTPRDTPRSIVRTRPLEISEPEDCELAPSGPGVCGSAHENESLLGTEGGRCKPGDCGFALSATVAISTLSSADRKICRTSPSVWCRRGCGREGPRMPANGFDRRTPSLNAERRTSHRDDTVDTDCPVDCHREIAARTSLGTKATRRRRPSESSTRARMTCWCDATVAGFHRCGAAKNHSTSPATVRRDASDANSMRLMPKSSTNSRLRCSAASMSPWTVKERWTLRE